MVILRYVQICNQCNSRMWNSFRVKELKYHIYHSYHIEIMHSFSTQAKDVEYFYTRFLDLVSRGNFLNLIKDITIK